MKKIILFLLAGVVAVALLIVFLYYNYSSNNIRKNYLKDGGFSRTDLSSKFALQQEYDLKKGNYNLVGFDNNAAFVKQSGSRKIVRYSTDNTKTNITLPKVVDPENIYYISFNPFLKSVIDVQCNNDRKIFVFDIDSQKIIQTVEFTNYFDKAVRMSSNTFCTVADDEKNTDQCNFTISSFNRGKEVVEKRSTFAFKSMVEDGTLSNYKDKFVYVNFYNNSFFALDSSLNKVFSAKTVDTVTSLPKIISLNNGTITKFKKQPTVVNQLSCVSGDYLFVNSLIKDDSRKGISGRSTFIDIYNLNAQGKYVGTFNIENRFNLQDMIVKDNRLILTYSDKLLIYEFTL